MDWIGLDWIGLDWVEILEKNDGLDWVKSLIYQNFYSHFCSPNHLPVFHSSPGPVAFSVEEELSTYIVLRPSTITAPLQFWKDQAKQYPIQE